MEEKKKKNTITGVRVHPDFAEMLSRMNTELTNPQKTKQIADLLKDVKIDVNIKFVKDKSKGKKSMGDFII
jgi:hypothetical protein|tara:strand:- start:851 stop:1063 length:213 start_codon:yes stop_codon:yes gene_type:complete